MTLKSSRQVCRPSAEEQVDWTILQRLDVMFDVFKELVREWRCGWPVERDQLVPQRLRERFTLFPNIRPSVVKLPLLVDHAVILATPTTSLLDCTVSKADTCHVRPHLRMTKQIPHRWIQIGIVDRTVADHGSVLILCQPTVTMLNPERVIPMDHGFMARHMWAWNCQHVLRISHSVHNLDPVLRQVLILHSRP